MEHTSIVNVVHSSAGLFSHAHPKYDVNSPLNGEIQFFDQYEACGRGEVPPPYNRLSYEDAELVNDIGVEILRWNVEMLKQRGKTIALLGTSWGGYVVARYLLYYPVEDFAHITLSGFNPNFPKERLITDRLYYNNPHTVDVIFGNPTGMSTGQELYEMNRWRMLPWLTQHDLSCLRLIIGSEDERVGFPLASEIKQLTDAGATVVELVGLGHNLGYCDPEPEITDTVFHLSWERNMRIHTRDGVEVIYNPLEDKAKSQTQAIPIAPKPIKKNKTITYN